MSPRTNEEETAGTSIGGALSTPLGQFHRRGEAGNSKSDSQNPTKPNKDPIKAGNAAARRDHRQHRQGPLLGQGRPPRPTWRRAPASEGGPQKIQGHHRPRKQTPTPDRPTPAPQPTMGPGTQQGPAAREQSNPLDTNGKPRAGTRGRRQQWEPRPGGTRRHRPNHSRQQARANHGGEHWPRRTPQEQAKKPPTTASSGRQQERTVSTTHRTPSPLQPVTGLNRDGSEANPQGQPPSRADNRPDLSRHRPICKKGRHTEAPQERPQAPPAQTAVAP